MYVQHGLVIQGARQTWLQLINNNTKSQKHNEFFFYDFFKVLNYKHYYANLSFLICKIHGSS